MKKWILLPIVMFSIIVASSVFSQDTWVRTIPSFVPERGNGVLVADDGGYIVLGMTAPDFQTGDEQMDALLIKTDAQGNQVWRKTFGGAQMEFAWEIQQTSDNGFIFTGSTSSTTSSERPVVWLVKTNATGHEQWSKTFGNGQSACFAYSVDQTSDEGYIVVGNTTEQGAGLNDVWLIKTNYTGNMQWSKTFGGTHHDGGNSVKQTTDGGYIITGRTRSFGAGFNDVWLIKTDENGNEQWNKTFGGSYSDGGFDVHQTTDGGYVIFGTTELTRLNGPRSIWIIKTDSNGEKVWDNTFGRDINEFTYKGRQTADGGYIIAGNSFDDVWLIKVDSDGEEEWNELYEIPGIEMINDVRQLSNGGYILTGSAEYVDNEIIFKEVLLIKTDASGIAIPRPTAREYLDEVNAAARAVTADAELIQVLADKLKLDGTSTEWKYLYQSNANQTMYRFLLSESQVSQLDEIGDLPTHIYLGMPSLPDKWLDSYIAITLAEADGGEAYRQGQPEYQIVAELSHNDGWGKVMWAMDYRIPGDCQIFFAEAVLQSNTAREYLFMVHAEATDYVPNAELVYIRSDDVNPDGTANIWKYVYEWAQRQTFYEFWTLGDQIVQFDLTITDVALQHGMTPMPLSWYDSDYALTRSEDAGGSQFRSDNADWNIEASIYMPPSTMKEASDTGNSARWSVNYSATDANQTYNWSAGSFSPDWTAQSSGTQSELRSVSAVSDLVCWASGKDGVVLRTTDGGNTWLDASTGLNPEHFYSIAGIDALTALIVTWESATAQAVIFRTSDGGASWTKVHERIGWLNGVTMFSATDGIAYGDPDPGSGKWIFLETSDGGQTWDLKDNSPDQLDGDVGGTAFWLNASVGWIGTNKPWAYHTTDGGSNWARVDVPGLSRVTRIGCDDQGNVLASSGYASESIMRSTNDGASWEAIPPPEDGYILQFAFHNRRFWMLSNTTVYKSVSLGDDWSPEVMAYGYLRCLSFTESHPYIHGWAAGNNGILLHYTFDTTPVLDNEPTLIPERFELSQNYPNPFNPETTIRYTLPSNSHVVIRIFNLLGQPVRNVESRSYPAGMHRYRWDGRDDDRNAVESGIYLLTIETKFGTEVRKMTLLK